VAALDIITDALQALGGSLSDVVRTRIMVQKEEDCEEVSRAHGWAFTCVGVRPANTLVVSGLIGQEYLVEIEAEAEIGYGKVLRFGMKC
jgi:enamine deaminase RidA (YjgF/YER057c/UK114 family)